MSDTDAKKLVKNVTDQLKTVSPISGYNSYNFDYLDAYQKMGMRERHVISPYLESRITQQDLLHLMKMCQ